MSDHFLSLSPFLASVCCCQTLSNWKDWAQPLWVSQDCNALMRNLKMLVLACHQNIPAEPTHDCLPTGKWKALLSHLNKTDVSLSLGNMCYSLHLSSKHSVISQNFKKDYLKVIIQVWVWTLLSDLARGIFISSLARRGTRTPHKVWNLPILQTVPSCHMFALAAWKKTEKCPLVNKKNAWTPSTKTWQHPYKTSAPLSKCTKLPRTVHICHRVILSLSQYRATSVDSCSGER